MKRLIAFGIAFVMICAAFLTLGVFVTAMDPLDDSDAFEDPDEDELNNAQEFEHGTDPLDPDSDDDTLPDGWEVKFGLNPLDPSDAHEDMDYAIPTPDSQGEQDAQGTYDKEPYTQNHNCASGRYCNYDEYHRFAEVTVYDTSTDPPTPHTVWTRTSTYPNWADTDNDGFLDPDDPDPLHYDQDLDDDGIPDWDNDENGIPDAQEPGNPNADSDNDGLTNGQESQMGTDPQNSDTDGDGMSDGQEAQAGTSPTNSDTDGDGVSDGQELQQGTDPNDADSDNDGLPDGSEQGSSNTCDGNCPEGSTDPNSQDSDNDGIPDWDNDENGIPDAQEPGNPNADSDNDGLTNGQESQMGTDPQNSDTDGDGMSDGQEAQAGTSPTNSDTDGDSVSDGQELQQGTDPNDADSDNDGLPDGSEQGSSNTCDGSCPEGSTDPNNQDSDNDGIQDPQEDNDQDGMTNEEEVNSGYPTDQPPDGEDTDGDGMPDQQDQTQDMPTDPNNPDTDGDGIPDSSEPYEDTNGNGQYDEGEPFDDLNGDGEWTEGEDANNNGQMDPGETSPTDPDTDNDGIPDGADPDPLTPNIRYHTDIQIKYVAGVPVSPEGLLPTTLSLHKGDEIVITIWLGLEDNISNSYFPERANHTDPDSWKPMNITFYFNHTEYGPDGLPGGGDDIIDTEHAIPSDTYTWSGTLNVTSQVAEITNYGGDPNRVMRYFACDIIVYIPDAMFAGAISISVLVMPGMPGIIAYMPSWDVVT
jgi:hypothetical protein